MASAVFARITAGRLLASTIVAGGASYAVLSDGDKLDAKLAAQEFHKSSIHTSPPGYQCWKIRNDYPTSELLKARKSRTSSPDPPTFPLPGYGDDFEGEHAPWLKIDFEKEPEKYAEIIREYCFDGMVPAGFRPQENRVRDWYHAPWMHFRDPNSRCTEREPINGLTFERATPAKEFAETQTEDLQNWACGFYNATGATVFGDMWKDPNNPDFTENKQFPQGTCVFKILMSNASKHQLGTFLDGSPVLHGVISPSAKDGKRRNDFASRLRLIQVDFAVVDDRSPIGWVFGTFMFNKDLTHKEPWERLSLVGIQWGNDHWLTQEKHVEHPDQKPRQCYITDYANKIRINLKGTRPSWGWNGRMNGPADNFISACASCHSTASRDPMYHNVRGVQAKYDIIPPLTQKGIPKPNYDDNDVMVYFRNVPAGVPFDDGLNPDDSSAPENRNNPKFASKTKSADYSLQLQVGWANFQTWKRMNETFADTLWRGTKYVIGADRNDPTDLSQRDFLRQASTVEDEEENSKS